MRGENEEDRAVSNHQRGSPPHARGRRLADRRSASAVGITPACAGKTRASRTSRASRRDHPRMRGEDASSRPMRPHASGSPPHARGRPTYRTPASSSSRITPACAGKTRASRTSRASRRDHPRMRGEDKKLEYGENSARGSPPHARGRQEVGVRREQRPRITPACAGKTSRGRRGPQGTTDHPRMRGEDMLSRIPRDFATGSPPHARGRQERDRSADELRGITPACAGKTFSRIAAIFASKDHPRMRGEDLAALSESMRSYESPPHARGRLDERLVVGAAARITPACAGKTLKGRAVIDCIPDHPRMRGEDVSRYCPWA